MLERQYAVKRFEFLRFVAHGKEQHDGNQEKGDEEVREEKRGQEIARQGQSPEDPVRA